ncbi:MAG: hypothetical protein SWY16_04615 [Cyanobacteriota bacterium]|nr:hypothetical protein [Cyanobacteriota bacterium]
MVPRSMRRMVLVIPIACGLLLSSCQAYKALVEQQGSAATASEAPTAQPRETNETTPDSTTQEAPEVPASPATPSPTPQPPAPVEPTGQEAATESSPCAGRLVSDYNIYCDCGDGEKPEAGTTNPVVEKPESETPIVFASVQESATGMTPAAGRVETNEAREYKNEFFGFTMQVPGDWVVAPEETRQKFAEMKAKELAGNDGELQASLKGAKEQLLYLSKYPVGKPNIGYNSHLDVQAEQISHLPGITSEKVYLDDLYLDMMQQNIPYSMDREVYEQEIDGRTFYRGDATVQKAGQTIKESVLVTFEKGHAVTFKFSQSEDGQLSVEEIARSIEF